MEITKQHSVVHSLGTHRVTAGGVEIRQHKNIRTAKSDDFNYIMDMDNGRFAMWGKDVNDNPEKAPFPTILDIEITSMCRGPAGKLCSFCYKSNTPRSGSNMTLAEFKNIIDKMPWLTQCALGADAQGTINPDMFEMMAYARSKGVIPNLTIADVSEEVAEKLAKVAGAVAVSVYPHAGKDVAYNSIKRLADAGMDQINIHYMISADRMEFTYEMINDTKTDPRLEKLNAIVFLSLKQKGRGKKHEMVSQEQYKTLVDYCLENDVPFGFDSCSSNTFLDSVKDHTNYDVFKNMAESCESTRMSSYINEKGMFFPCSFTENWDEGGWSEGINVLEADDFIKDVWDHPRTVAFKNCLIENVDSHGECVCPAYEVCGKKGYKKEWNGTNFVPFRGEAIEVVMV